MKRRAWVYDYETIINAILVVFVDLKNPKDRITFRVDPWKNQFLELAHFLKTCIENKDSMYSYNGLRFDNQISQFIVENMITLGRGNPYREIYEFAQFTIRAGNMNSGVRFKYPHWKNPFRERDIMQINNYSNPAKRCSLKWLQFGMNWHNLQEMPIPHDIPITEDQIPQIESYCINDCLSLRKKVLLDKGEILLRDVLTTHFKENLLSASEPQIAKKIFGNRLAKALGISYSDLNKMSTYRKRIHLSEVILPYIQFKNENLQKTLNKFKNTVLDGENLKGSFSEKTHYKGIEISYALGGIHGAKRGIHVSDADYIIMSFDVTSFYPFLAIKNRWAPAHLPLETFIEVYEENFYERAKYPKSNPLNYVYKIILNAIYGLSNEKHGNFMKDPQYTMKVTCNGQLLLTMLMEQLVEAIPGSEPLMYNTDGGEIKIPRKHIQTFYDVCKKWEELTKLSLEYEKYSKLIIADVNTYLGIYEGVPVEKEKALADLAKCKAENLPKPLYKKTKDGTIYHYKVKAKGRYVVDRELHKNNSFRIIRMMLYNYFVHNTPISETLDNHKVILDFCGCVRVKSNDKLFYEVWNPETSKLERNTVQKTNRYYMSKSGGKLIKHTPKTKAKIEAFSGYERILNKYSSSLEFESCEIDRVYYLTRAKDELKKFILLDIEKQTLLF